MYDCRRMDVGWRRFNKALELATHLARHPMLTTDVVPRFHDLLAGETEKKI